MPAKKELTEAEIEAGKSPKGGYTREQLAEWGVPWPPPRGWKDRLMGKEPLPEGSFVNDAGVLLRMTITHERYKALKEAADASAIDLHQYALIMLGKMIDRGEFLQPEDWWQGHPEDLEAFKRG